MHITSVNVSGFGKLRHRTFTLRDGINLVEGANESGKTTLHLFIKAMFYGLSAKKKAGQKSEYELFCPWQDPKTYGGTLEFSSSEKSYLIKRDFNVSPGDLMLYEITDGHENAVEEPEARLRELLFGMSESAFLNTLFLRQLHAEAKSSLADEIISYASNAGTSASPALNALRSIEYLSSKKKELKEKIEPDAHRSYNITLGKIRALKDELSGKKFANGIKEAIRKRDEQKAALERIALMKSAKEEDILLVKEELKGSGIESEAQAIALIENVKKLYSDYKKKKGCVPLFIILAFILILSSAAVTLTGIVPDYRLAALPLGLSLLLLIAAISKGKKAKTLEKELNGLLSFHLGTDFSKKVKASDINDFMLKAEGYRETGARLDSLRKDQAKIIEEMSKASDEYNLSIKALDRELSTKESAEEKMRLLKKLSDEAQVLRRTTEANEAISIEIEAIEMAADTIRELSESISRSAGSYINRETGRMIEGFTAGRYKSVNVDSRLNVSLMGPQGMIPLKELSQGTMDQVYLALRIASGKLASGGKSLPLLMDDSFAMYDDERLLASLGFIAGQYPGQVIIFSCQGREGAAFSILGIEHHRLSL